MDGDDDDLEDFAKQEVQLREDREAYLKNKIRELQQELADLQNERQ